MDKRKIVDIEYKTGNVSFARVRKGVLQKREQLERMGYRCAWKTDLEIENKTCPMTLRESGYLDLGDHIITSFDKDGLPFAITIYQNSRRARIHGSNHVYLDEFESTKREFEQFSKLTKILIEPKISSEPYSS